MSFLTLDAPRGESLVADSQFPSPATPPSNPRPIDLPGDAASPLERLAQLVLANDRLMEDLASSRRRISRARAYQDEPGCNVRFGAAHLERCRSKHSGILAQLRANRIEALGLLGRSGSAI